MRIDIERYGSLIFALGNLWRWLSSRLSATRRVPETVARLWAAILRLYRESRAAIIRALRPGLQRLGLLKTPTRELLRALDDARLDSVFERGLPSEYLRHFDFSPLTDEGLFLGFDEEFAHINAAIERWRVAATLRLPSSTGYVPYMRRMRTAMSCRPVKPSICY